MATANITSEFLGLLNRISGASDPVGELLGVSLDNMDAVEGLTDATIGEPTVTSATPSLIQVVLPVEGEDALTFEVNGSGIGPLSDMDDFLGAVLGGTATGSLSGLGLSQGTTEILGVDLSSTAIEVRSGDQTIDLTGTFPTALASLPSLLGAAALLDPETLADLDADDRSALVAALTPISLSELTVSDGDTEVVNFTVAPTGVTLTLGGYTAQLAGAMPANLGAFATGIFAGVDAGGDPVTSVLGGLDISGLTVLNPAGVAIADLDGPLMDLDDLDLTIDGVALPEGVPVLFDLAGANVDLTATDEGSILIGTVGQDTLTGGAGDDTALALAGDDVVDGGAGADTLSGDDGNDRLLGGEGDDLLNGGLGTDTLNGGAGNDTIFGGTGEADLRDVIYGGSGNDVIDGGHGNDEVRGDAGNDNIAGGFGADTVLGGEGNDTLTGSAYGDLLFGAEGDDFINGGFGYDRVNGGDGADDFYHLGIFNHGSDWIQDYDASEGDVLVFGRPDATRAQFQINVATTPTAGAADVDEAFIVYRPTGQIMWALVDGDGQEEINLQIGAQIYDLTDMI